MLAIVLGTYNRREHLERALDAVTSSLAAGRQSQTPPHHFIIIDGGSTDGTREMLAAREDVTLIGQRGPLRGAVRAFNLGFRYAIEELAAEWIAHWNDDVLLETPGALQAAIQHMANDRQCGAVAFEFDTWGHWGFDCGPIGTYVNYGVWRRECLMQVARKQGDPSGCRLWNPCYRTYAADTEAGQWAHVLGWKIHRGRGWRVHDVNPQDDLREGNNPKQDQATYHERWDNSEHRARLWETWRYLHLGCGDKRMAEPWVNVDGVMTPAADFQLTAYELSMIPDETCTWIYSSHMIEHIYPDKLPAVLRELHRICRRGGRLTLATIDFPGIYACRYQTHENGEAWNAALYGNTRSTDHPFDAHRQAFDYETLSGLLKEAGFRAVNPWTTEDYPEIHELNDYARSCAAVTCFAEATK